METECGQFVRCCLHAGSQVWIGLRSLALHLHHPDTGLHLLNSCARTTFKKINLEQLYRTPVLVHGRYSIGPCIVQISSVLHRNQKAIAVKQPDLIRTRHQQCVCWPARLPGCCASQLPVLVKHAQSTPCRSTCPLSSTLPFVAVVQSSKVLQVQWKSDSRLIGIKNETWSLVSHADLVSCTGAPSCQLQVPCLLL